MFFYKNTYVFYFYFQKTVGRLCGTVYFVAALTV